MADEKDKPGFDEQTLAMLLEAAYVLQQQGRNTQQAAPPLAAPPDQPQRQAVPEPVRPRIEPPTQAAASSHAESITPENFLPEPAPATPASTPPASKDDYTFTLAQIVGTQDQIRLRDLELETAISLVTERVLEIAKAGGAAIALLDGMKVRYRGAAGLMALPLGTELPVEKALCVACLRAGQVIRCSNLNSEFLLDVEACQRRGIQAIIAVPIYHDGKIAGALEIYFSTTQAFTDQDVHTCQLMAGLITEALAREEERSWKKSVVSERSMMLETLERLKPSLTALVDTPAARNPAARSAAVKSAGMKTVVPSTSAPPKFICRNCGHQLLGEEQFCGSCGAARSADPTTIHKAEYEAPRMQSTAASLWHEQEALLKSALFAPATGDLARDERLRISDPIGPEKPLADSIEEEMPELFAAPELRLAKMPPPVELPTEELLIPSAVESPTHGLRISLAASNDLAEEAALAEAPDEIIGIEKEKDDPEAATALAPPAPAANWGSAITAREFLEQLAAAKQPGGVARFWRARRGDIYLAIAVILVAAVIRWGIWSSHSVSATGTPAAATAGHHKPAPDSDLSTFDRLLIALGLADEPPAPENKGNPDTEVWIDLHTALYYCPGADLYGKTPKGKFATQRDAQLDQFEPAYRKACD